MLRRNCRMHTVKMKWFIEPSSVQFSISCVVVVLFKSQMIFFFSQKKASLNRVLFLYIHIDLVVCWLFFLIILFVIKMLHINRRMHRHFSHSQKSFSSIVCVTMFTLFSFIISVYVILWECGFIFCSSLFVFVWFVCFFF